MSYHKTNLGNYAGYVDQYADIDGYVPQHGDSVEDFNWDAMIEWDEDGEDWSEFVADAVEATEKAEKALNEWREGGAKK